MSGIYSPNRMNYYGPRQRQGDKRWDYTCKNDGHTYPVGYCAPFRRWTDEELARFGFSRQMVEADEKLEAGHHEGGHATEGEACECYKKYLLDRYLRLGQVDANHQNRCEVCGEFTQLYATIPSEMKHWVLCERHNTREGVEKVFPAPSEIWSS
jgi:hypothetical protein